VLLAKIFHIRLRFFWKKTLDIQSYLETKGLSGCVFGVQSYLLGFGVWMILDV